MSKVLIMPVIGQQTDDPESAGQAIIEVYWLWCPACQDHVLITSDWKFNGNVEQPGFELPIYTVVHDNICHAKLTDGIWYYQEDSTHKFAGQELPAADVPMVAGIDSTHV